MIKKFFLLLSFILLSVNANMAFAEEYDSDYQEQWWANAPDKYLPKATLMIISTTSACNQNGEPFKDFIIKFRNDKSFREERTWDNEELKYWVEQLGYWNCGKGYQLLKATQKKQKCDCSFGTWYNISADEVYFTYQDVLLCDDDGGSALYAYFHRVIYQWYLMALVLVG